MSQRVALERELTWTYYHFLVLKQTEQKCSSIRVESSSHLALRLAPGKAFQQSSAVAVLVLQAYFCLLLLTEVRDVVAI